MSQPNSYLLRCSACGTKNRIPSDKVGLTAKCGKCGASIHTADAFTEKPVIITDNNFDAQVLKSPLPVLLDCWAPWCGPCQMLGPVIEELASEWKGKVRVAKLNSDENPGISAKFQIRSIPSILIFDNGQLKDTLVGAMPKQTIIQKMAPYI
ncbi:thioredoxin TrxC [Desulfonema magnum]|uniref:Thioredoxin n=1 Tax=Desulfonema magnum TaxID=45655 RepID=A0A975BRR1_9BACT|nr:thioredoxin TrxC [Desulfonema magnum]QTA90183.1 Thioredoxin [Desulfonema magnum]